MKGPIKKSKSVQRLHVLSLKVHFCNIRGVHSNLHAIHHHLETERPHLLFLTETEICDPSDCAYLSYPGYILESKFHPHAGVCMYANDEICCRRLPDLEVPDLSGMWVHVDTGRDQVVYASVYRSHSGDRETTRLFEYLSDAAEMAQQCYPSAQLVLLGDFNGTMLVSEATRIPDVAGHTAYCLDLLLTTDPDRYLVSISAPLGTSDYCLVKSVSHYSPPDTCRKGTRRVWRYKSAEQTCFSSSDPSCCADAVSSVITQAMVYFIPYADVSLETKAHPWFNTDCLLAEKRKQEAYCARADARKSKAVDTSTKKKLYNVAAKFRKKVHGSWGLPAFMCDIYIAMDVTSSTSSIFNLVAISVDRYIAVTQPIKYAKHKNNRRVWFTIVLVWLVSATIGAPIVLGLNDTPDRNFDECLFNSQNYVIYSSLGSFYIPCIMMMFLYYNIFKALSIRAKKQRAAKKPPVSGDPTTGATTAVVIENVAQTRRLQETALHDDRATNTGSGSNEGDHEDSFDKKSADLEADADECHVIRNDKSTEFMLATVREETAYNTPKKFHQPVPDPNGNNDSGYAPSNLEDTIREHGTPPGSPGMKNATVLKNMGYDGSRKNGKPKDTDSRTVSLAFRSEDDLETSHYDVRDGSSSKKERKASAATARFTIYKANKASKKKREKSSAKKERKATKTLAIVLGVFLFCWAPFFTCNVLDAICVKLNLPFSPGVTVFILTTWLGYINSFLNPVIYTIFNPEFRKAFRKILKCGP